MAAMDEIKPTPLEDESAVMAVAKEMARTVVEKVVDVATKPRKIVKVSVLVLMVMYSCCVGKTCSDRWML
jgi:hypothetical protein